MSDYPLIREKFGAYCVFNEPASGFTTYRAGGRAEVVVKPGSADEMVWLSAWCRSRGVPLTVLGRGSNILVSDNGLRGVTALTERLSGMDFSGDTAVAQAGALWDDVVRLSAERGLAGFERTSGIPGSVGGAVRMNAGAFGQETFDRLVSVEALDASGRVVSLEKKSIAYGYRSVAGLSGLIILSAKFKFGAGDSAALLEERSRVLSARAAKQPLNCPSAGSVFKRPPGDYASRLIDASGLKGLRIGGAEVSAKHAGFIVNSGGASAADIFALICEVRSRVKAATGVELELEQVLLGDF